MADEEDAAMPGSPVLPKKGSYDIDFDALDDSYNPFQSNVKLGSSPPIQSSSSYNFDADNFDDIDPFKTKTVMQNSPVGSPKDTTTHFNNNNNEPGVVDHKEQPIHDAGGEADTPKAETVGQSVKPSPKKKKVIKKSKIQSKIKSPRSLPKTPEQQPNDDIQIFMPGEKTDSALAQDGLPSIPEPQPSTLPVEEDLPPPPASFFVDDDASTALPLKSPRPSSLEEDVPFDPVPEAMVSSSEMDSQFVNTEDLEYLGQNSVASKEKVTKPSVSQHASHAQGISDDGFPAVKKSPRGQEQGELSKEKHPAARALEAANAGDDTPLKKQVDIKNESSSEDTTFYDAQEYPSPVVPGDTKIGQKSMQTSPTVVDDGASGKGTMVQLVQNRPTYVCKRVLRYSQSDWNKLKQELELGFQATLLTKEREWSALLGERDKKLEQAEENNKRLRQTNEDMRTVVAEFEKTISQLQAEKERHKKDLNKTTTDLERDRDQAVEDLQSVESAFSDLHRRYEKSKGIIEGFKKNEEQLKEHVDDLQAKLRKSESKLQSLRSQAEEKLDRANEDIEQIKRSTKSDVARLEAALKKSEIRICTLEESLQRKEKENQELTSICDELIAKVGS